MTGRRGWTLLEVVVVLLVLVLGALVAVPAFRGAGSNADDGLAQATRRLEVLFGLARDSAIRAGTPVTLLIDSVAGRLWLDARESHGAADWEGAGENTGGGLASSTLGGAAGLSGLGAGAAGRRIRPSGLERPGSGTEGTRLELPAGVELVLPRARARFTFLPSGAVQGDSVILRSGSVVRVITLNPWTGDAVAY
jgi:prepilin-type N-terminal cleavage/methylation domain-containing protein